MCIRDSPWTLAKDPAKKDRLGTVMYHLAEGLRIVGVLLGAFLPDTSQGIRTQLGIADDAAYTLSLIHILWMRSWLPSRIFGSS